jgi:uncharacterized protein (DUF433 family)
MHIERITHDPAIMGGKPCIRGLRVTVGTILGLLASGTSRERILQGYPYPEPEDLDACWLTRHGGSKSGKTRAGEEMKRRAGSRQVRRGRRTLLVGDPTVASVPFQKMSLGVIDSARSLVL